LHCGISPSKKVLRTARVARLNESGVDVKAYIAGNRVKKSEIVPKDGPSLSFKMPALMDSWSIELIEGGLDESYSDPSSWSMEMGIDPFRCAWSSALGKDRRK
jgi:hypothetical protein